ncbi:MAG: MFS transporter, partial [Corynebacterium sp.]|nr:MFS transporter [Corynebacterium sp.]
FGQILGPIVVGGLADYFGFAKAFSVCAGVAAMGVVAWLCGRETLQERRAIVRRIPLRKKKRL